MGTHALASSVSYQITSYNVNTDVNDNYYSYSFETPRKNNLSYSSFGDTITTMTTPNLSKIPPPGNNIYIFQIEGKTVRAVQFDK